MLNCMFFIYILHSEKSDLFYVGYTSNINLRLSQHNEQDTFSTYTRKHRPWLLCALFQCGEDEGDAIKLERFIKKQHSRNFIEKLVDPHFVPTGQLAKLVRVPHVRD